MKKITLLLSLLIFLAGCAKQSQELVDPEPPQEANLAIDVNRMDLDKIDSEPIIPQLEETVVETKPSVTEKQPPAVEETPSEITSTEESKSSSDIADASTTKTPEEPVFIDERKPKYDYSHEVLFPDSSWDKYMIKRGDFLIKIAKNEYNDWTMWRTIYKWNKEIIGEDPNKIYPYNWLDLLKPSEEVKACKLTFFPRQTRDGESLWTIAKDVYGDEYAWIVLFWDNEELLEENDGIIYPGMELQIRDRVDPCDTNS